MHLYNYFMLKFRKKNMIRHKLSEEKNIKTQLSIVQWNNILLYFLCSYCIFYFILRTIIVGLLGVWICYYY